MYIQRSLDLQGILSSRSLFLFGPRKTGKSSYIKNQLSGMEIALTWNLLDGRLRLRLLSDPSLLRQEVEVRNLRDCLVVIDEIQKCPQLLDEVHYLIEERNIRFLLTGSSARKLRRSGVNLLGGRAGQRHLHPFNFKEVEITRATTFPLSLSMDLCPRFFIRRHRGGFGGVR